MHKDSFDKSLSTSLNNVIWFGLEKVGWSVRIHMHDYGSNNTIKSDEQDRTVFNIFNSLVVTFFFQDNCMSMGSK